VRHLVLGTAGHIDHGKSALVRALTGTDPDRLAEEKRRGITIDLGFADLDLGQERILSFVDVPGHERFVRHMVAGATGIEAVLLVVAADQGVQPQTREHLDICGLLGVPRGVIALTKGDLVDPELAQVVELEVRELVGGTFLDEAPLLHVSAESGAGLEDLRRELGALFDVTPRRSAEGLPRLPVDRSFVLKGFGTVVTGTLAGGRLDEGQEIAILPRGIRGRIRGLHVHGRKVAQVSAGQRAAVNLQGLDCGDAPRGSTITTPGVLATSRRAWARLTLLPDAPAGLRKGGEVRLHHGTTEGPARLRVLKVAEDGTFFVELHLAEETVLAPGDRFILRRPAPVDTIGGGVVVDAKPPHAREFSADAFSIDVLAPEAALGLRLERAGAEGLTLEQLARDLGVGGERVEQTLQALREEGRVVGAGSRWFDASTWSALSGRTVESVAEFHERHPLHTGVSREALRGRLCAVMPQEAWRDLLEGLVERGEIRLDGEVVARHGHEVVLGTTEAELARRIDERYRSAGLEPPELDEVVEPSEGDRARPIVELLIAEGKLERIQGGRLFHAEALARLRAMLRDYALTSPTIDVAEFKRLAGVTRKNAIPLLEQLDVERTTRRVGNLREIISPRSG